MKFDSRDLTLMAIFGALYVVINVVQSFSVGNPTIYGPIQLRVADCLIALAALFGLPVVGGVTLGCFVSNFIYFLGAQDVLFGSLANLVAAIVVFLLRKHRLVACFSGAFPIGLIVGFYLPIFFQFSAPEVLDFMPPVAAMIVSLTISSLISVAVLGYLLLLALSRPSILEPLKSHGLKTAVRYIDMQLFCNMKLHSLFLGRNYMNLSSLVSPIISSKSKPNASKT